MPANADALLITMQDQMNADLIAQLPRSVQMIATVSVGFDYIDVDGVTFDNVNSAKPSPSVPDHLE